jgi:hypothetical protein
MDVTPPPQVTVKVPSLNPNAHPKSPVTPTQLSTPVIKLTKPVKPNTSSVSQGGLPVFQQQQCIPVPPTPIGTHQQQQPSFGSSWVDTILDDAIQQLNQHFIPSLYLSFNECSEDALRFFFNLTQSMSFTQLAALWTWYAVGLPPAPSSILRKFGSFAQLLTMCHALLNTPIHNQSQYGIYLGEIERFITIIEFLVLQRLNVKMAVAYSRNVLQQQVHQQAQSSSANSSATPSGSALPLDGANGAPFNANPYFNQQ